MVRVTFTLDDDTVARLRRCAARLGKSKSQIVREAIERYEPPSDKLSDHERTRLLDVFDRFVANAPRRPAAEVDAELRDIRSARRDGGRRHPAP